jgi:hypothetical protein
VSCSINIPPVFFAETLEFEDRKWLGRLKDIAEDLSDFLRDRSALAFGASPQLPIKGVWQILDIQRCHRFLRCSSILEPRGIRRQELSCPSSIRNISTLAGTQAIESAAPQGCQGGSQVMNYWLDLFTGTTWQEFRKTGANISGFRERMRPNARRVRAAVIGSRRYFGIELHRGGTLTSIRILLSVYSLNISERCRQGSSYLVNRH